MPLRSVFFTSCLVVANSAPAYADATSQSLVAAGAQTDFDTLTFEQVTAYAATITYRNAEALTSRTMQQDFEGDSGLRCTAFIVVGGSTDPETITVKCDGLWMPDVSEARVDDGDEIVISLDFMGF